MVIVIVLSTTSAFVITKTPAVVRDNTLVSSDIVKLLADPVRSIFIRSCDMVEDADVIAISPVIELVVEAPLKTKSPPLASVTCSVVKIAEFDTVNDDVVPVTVVNPETVTVPPVIVTAAFEFTVKAAKADVPDDVKDTALLKVTELELVNFPSPLTVAAPAPD